MFDWIMGFVKTLWMIAQLIFAFFKAMCGLGSLTQNSIYECAHNLSCTFVAWATGILLMSPFSSSILGGGGSDGLIAYGDQAGAQSGLNTALGNIGLGGLPLVCIEAGLALTMICFFYGFAESSVQLEKTNIQLIFSRILRWIISVGIVSVSYLMFSYLFAAFRSIYSLTGGAGGFAVDESTGSGNYTSIYNWYSSTLGNIKPTVTDGDVKLIDVQSFIDTPMSADPVLTDMATSADWTSVRNGGIGTLILIFGLIKLFKKALKFVVEQVPSFAKVVVFFVCAPFGLAMYAAPETQQKANQYIRQFSGAVLTNLFKVLAISLSAYVACRIAFPVGSGSVAVLNVQQVAAHVFDEAFTKLGSTPWASGTSSLYANDLAFLVTSGGLLGYMLFFDIIGKASEIAERFAHEIMT